MATSNKTMSDMMRKRRDEMSDLPMYEPPTDAGRTSPAPEARESTDEAAATKFTVAAPGEPSGEGERFEYEPMIDIPGAWVVYPPGVPCDDTEYRIQMDSPATAEDFPKMQKALDDASGGTATESTEPAVESEEGVY